MAAIYYLAGKYPLSGELFDVSLRQFLPVGLTMQGVLFAWTPRIRSVAIAAMILALTAFGMDATGSESGLASSTLSLAALLIGGGISFAALIREHREAE